MVVPALLRTWAIRPHDAAALRGYHARVSLAPSTQASDRIWKSTRDRKVTAALGRLPEAPADLELLRVSCEVAQAALRPLLESRRQAEAVLGAARARPDPAKSVRRRSLFGDTPERATEAVVVDLWNQLARHKARWVIVFEAVEQADEATLTALTAVVRRPGWLRLPLLLIFHDEPQGAAAELLAAVRAVDADAVVQGGEAPASESGEFDWKVLPPEVVRVLRAGALIGAGFDTRTVAELLGIEPLEVLEQLQHAIDLGVPVEDRGEGRFSLPHAALTALSSSLLASLAQAWHRQLGRLLGARAARDVVMPPPPPPPRATMSALREGRGSDARVTDIIDLSTEVTDLAEETGKSTASLKKPPPVRRRTMFAAPAAAPPAPTARTVTTELDDPVVDELRAAEHMRLAGDLDAAAGHMCEAARRTAEMGAPQAATQHALAALELLATLPGSAPRRQLRVQALLELGRVQWQSAGYEFGFTLAQARATLDAARAELDDEAPLELAVELAQATAGVHFDLGDPDSLRRARVELESASEMSRAAGDLTGAACLLNDQAAVQMRMGDSAGAVRLLRESREFFEARGVDDPIALRELAETDHLFARLPLSVRMHMGQEEAGYVMGLDFALAAERTYKALDDVRELARVWETMGRLELKRCRVQQARERLEAAVAAQTRIGDLMGLATTTEVLSQVLAWCGRNAEAVKLLRDSVVFNRDKGSPLGLMFDRGAFTALSSRLASLPAHADGLREVEVLLTAGERELGALPQPNEADIAMVP